MARLFLVALTAALVVGVTTSTAMPASGGRPGTRAVSNAAPAGSATAKSSSATRNDARAAKAGVTITTRNISGYGRVLVDGRGLPLYVFTADRGRSSRCYGACAKAWPVTYAGGTPRASGAARQDLIGTTRRRDGRRQVTYRGRPLYFYVHDRPGVALCHNVREFGGLWLLIRSNGRRV